MGWFCADATEFADLASLIWDATAYILSSGLVWNGRSAIFVPVPTFKPPDFGWEAFFMRHRAVVKDHDI